MTRSGNFINLEYDLRKKKQVVLFVGAGINTTSYPNINMSWDALMETLFCDALRYLSIEKDIPAVELNIIRQGLNKDELSNEKQNFKELLKIRDCLDYEFPTLIKASVIKEILGDNYISAIQRFLYSQCDKKLIRKMFQETYTLQNRKKIKAIYPFYTLYTMARFVILYPYVKAIVSYNYDNFLKVAISILLDSREEYFTNEELKHINARNLVIQDRSGFLYNQEMTNDILSIYHVHGYIQPPSESVVMGNNQIVLSMDEYHEIEKDAYSWPTATQLHFLSHYTCMLVGMSLTDPTPQRMLYHVKHSGNDDNIYYLSAKSYPLNAEKYLGAYNSLRAIKNAYHAKCGLEVIYNPKGYHELFSELNTMIDNLKL